MPLTLKNKLLVCFLIVGTIPVLTSGFFSIMRSYDIAIERSREYTAEMLRQAEKHLQSKIQYVDNVALSAMINHSLIELLNQEDDVAKGRNKREVENYLKSLLISHRELASIVIIDRVGTVYSGNGKGLSRHFRLEESDLFRDVIAAKGRHIWFERQESVMMAINEKPSQVFPSAGILKSIYPTYGEYEGFMIINFSEKALVSIVEEAFADTPGNLYVLDGAKRTMLQTKTGEASPALESACVAGMVASSGDYACELGGREHLISYVRNERTGWVIASAMPVGFLAESANDIRDAIVTFSAIAGVLAVLFALLITRGVTRRFTQLQRVMRRVQAGDFATPIQEDKPDEIGQLSNAFAEMVHRVNALIRNNYEQKLREKNAQIKAMQAQILPHFLYNTLDSINWMLIERKEFDISRMVTALGNLFRASINRGDTLVTLRDEIAHVEDYLLLQKLRFEDRFQYRFEVDERLLDRRMPKFVLQPIVENALVHGLAQTLRDGRIEVLAYRDGNDIALEVRDNGVGIPEAKLRGLLLEEEAEGGADGAGGRVGLHNIHHRVRLLYGPDYGVALFSPPGGGAIARVRLPGDGSDRRETEE
jgi:two-component system sensor histidine kinase YesM